MGVYDREYFRDSNQGRLGYDALTPVVKYLIIINVIVFVCQLVIVRDASPYDKMREMVPDWDRLMEKARKQGELARQRTTKQVDDAQPKDDDLKDEPLTKTDTDGDDNVDSSNPELDLPYDDVFQFKQSIVQEWFELSPQKVVYQGQIWRLLTHAFCHDRYGLYHILINMVLLYWFGSVLESIYSSREFLLFYLCAAVTAGMAFVALALYTDSRAPGIGASGAVMAVMVLYTMHFPRQVIYVFWVIPLEMRWVMLLYLAWDLHPVLLELSGERLYTGVGHSAHLGGALFGFLYYRYQWHLSSLLGGLASAGSRRPRLRVAPATIPIATPEPDPEMERIDELLQKILVSGKDSLTDEERAILENASKRIKERRGES